MRGGTNWKADARRDEDIARVGLKHGSVKTVHCLHSRFKPARAVSNDEYPTSIYSKKNIKWRLEPTTLFTEAGDVVQNEDTPIS